MASFRGGLSSPDTNAGLDRFAVFHLGLLLHKNLFDGVCILEHGDTLGMHARRSE